MHDSSPISSQPTETSKSTTRRLSLLFPYYYGPSIRPYGAALLWFGQLDSIVMPWGSPYPVEAVQKIATRARQRALPISELFEIAAYYFNASCLLIDKESQALAALNDRITRVAAVSPGGTSPYQLMQNDIITIVEAMFPLLGDRELMRIACSQFIWRCYEYSLEMSADDVLDKLSEEEEVRKGQSLLLAQCLANHYCAFLPATSSVVVSDRNTTKILADIGNLILETKNLRDSKSKPDFDRIQIASIIFENVLGNLCPLITNHTAERYRLILGRTDAIESAKEKCRTAAEELVKDIDNPELYNTSLRRAVAALREEAQEIAEIDAISWRSFCGKLFEDRVIWASLMSFMGGLVGAMPAVTLAAAAVAVLSTAAGKGVSQTRERTKALKKSEWRFVYELNKRRIEYPGSQPA